jgi:hypothetical protein
VSARPISEAQSPAAVDVDLPDEDETVPGNFVFTPQSSRVVEAGYDAGSRRLYMRFVKPVDAGGTPWVYEGVPSNVWRDFQRVKSKGKFVNRRLNQYQNHRGVWT